MKNPLRKLRVALLCLLLLSGLAITVEPNESQQSTPTAKAVVIICKGMIDEGLFKSIERRTQIALDEGIEYLIYEIVTFGGNLLAAYNIWEYLMHEINPQAKTVAYVSKKAISSGALISVA